VKPNRESTGNGRRAIQGERNAGRTVQRVGFSLIKLPMVIVTITEAQTNPPTYDQKESL
jgi:hypothetical protein